MTLRVQVVSFDLNQPNREHLLPGWVVECPGKSCPSLGMSLKRGIRVEQCGRKGLEQSVQAPGIIVDAKETA